MMLHLRGPQLTRFLILSLSSHPCFGLIYNTAQQLPSGVRYDFIVVGGGTAGLVVANRLTENKKMTVLVLEAGVSHEGALNVQIPFLATTLPNTVYDWNFTTVPQTAINNLVIPYTRGHLLGGCSSNNYMFYTRGTSEDFDRYAAITSDSGWSWNRMLPYFYKNERWSSPPDNHNTAGQYNPIYHRSTGVNSVSLPGFPQPIDGRVIQTTRDLSQEFPFNRDYNSGRPLGVGWLQSTINSRGARSSSATSYLASDVSARPNLHILINARVTRLIQTATRNGKPSFQAVEVLQSPGGVRRIEASKEVILSAGSIGTPVILLNSGIGDRQSLSRVGVKTLVHLPSVGRNLSDQTNSFNVWYANTTDTLEKYGRDPALSAAAFGEWVANRTGRFVETVLGNQIIWSRLPKNSPLLRNRPDPSPGPNSPHFEIIPVNGFVDDTLPPTTGFYVSLVTVLLSPVARGSVQIRSSNPLDAPIINPALLADDLDIGTMREAVKSAKRFMAAPAWKGYVLAPFGTLANTNTDAQLDNHIRGASSTIYHPLGSAQMSRKGASYGVVDPDLKVKGIAGLRIVDGSVVPLQPSGHPQAVIYAFAERASDLIKADWGL